jgi:hypothetical protein
MSDFDGTETHDAGHDSGYDGGHDASQLDAGEQHYDLDHNAQAYGNEHDANQDYNAYGEANNYENDQHLDHGHAVEYDNPQGGHYAEQDYTNYDSHEAASSAAFGEHYSAESHDAAFADLDHLKESFDAQYLHEGQYEVPQVGHGQYEGGEQALSAAK